MGEYKRRWGDRADARWVRDLDGLHVIMPHLMEKRTDAEVYVNMEFDVTDALRYIEEKNRNEEEYKATLFHCILMAIAKTVYLRPDLNRYISGGAIISAMRLLLALWPKSALRITARKNWW